MILEDYLAPVRESLIEKFEEQHPQLFASQIGVHRELQGIPDLSGVKIAILGVLEDRGGKQNRSASDGADQVREYLYPLYFGNWQLPVVDLGNIYKGETLNDSYEGVKEVIYQLLKKDIIPILIGGTQDLTYANYRAYDNMEQTVNLVSIDSRFDLGNHENTLDHKNFLSAIVLRKPYILFNYSNIGYQTYFVNNEEIDLMERMYFDANRLGQFRNNISESEPILRDADIVSFDISAVRQSDAPGGSSQSPNGFSGEEACALARYAGISDKVSSFGVYEYNPALDSNGRTAHLMAQMVWYFIEGCNSRKGDYPYASKKDYQKFTVLINEGEHELTFYKSHLSGRWWIEVPMKESYQVSSVRHKLVPCSYSDYQKACENDVPLRWWQAMKKAL